MIVIAIDLPPPSYPIAQDEQRIDFDPYDTEEFGFRFRGDYVERLAGETGTSNAPARSMRAAEAIGSPWRVRTSASAIDRSLGFSSATADAALDVPGQLAEIRRLTGYSWEQLAGLIGCTRQAAHRWMNGEPIADGNRERLARIHATLRFVDRGSADENRAVLDIAADGATVAELLRQERFEEAREAAGKGPGRQDARWGKVVRPSPDPEDHWLARLAFVDDAVETEPVRAKPQTFKRLALKKG